MNYKTLMLAPMPVFFAIPAQAMDGEAGEKTIIVTAQRSNADEINSATKLDTPLIETPQAISIVDEDFIDAINARTVAESLNYTSGVRSQAFGSDTRIEYYQLRGFNNSSFFKDGLVLYNSGAFFSWTTPPEGIGRLEVLKGPSSVLYGSSNAGGLVNIVSKAPDRENSASLELGGDEYGTFYGSTDMSVTISDTVSIRSVGLIRRGQTQVQLAKDDRSYISASANWSPDQLTSFTLRTSYTGDRSNRPTGFIPYSGSVTPLSDGRRIPLDLFISDPRADRYDRDQYEIGYSFERELDQNLKIISHGRYAKLNLVYAGLFGSFRGNPEERDGQFFLNRGNSSLEGSLNNIAIDTQLIARFDTGPFNHALLVGIDYSRSDLESSRAFGSAPALNIFAPDYTLPLPPLASRSTTLQSVDQTGLYIQNQIKTGNFSLIVSGRHDYVNIETNENRGNITRGAPEKTSYRVGLVYVSDSGFAPYINYATSFTPLIGTDLSTGNFYQPETGRQYELGLRYQPENQPFALSASLFDIERDGVLVSDPVPGSPFNQSQGGRQRSRGGEVEVQMQAFQGFNLRASATAFDLVIRDGTEGEIGRTPAATPQITAAAYAEYMFFRSQFPGGFRLGAGARYTGNSYADTANTLKLNDALIFDLSLGYEIGALQVAVNISNLFNKRYFAACPSANTCYSGNFRRATFSLNFRI
ncbi:TonB-dependent siderophore receptor [Parasphingorhabdus cellanae]|uniref:TonB-dependent siderophore receptor n=1 Tax=Parasphingorhabdus cellanae TaxID=2806553 RepID=A0ABX7T2Q8_9SPHN|nr:TonB-dependent siderophore receptor [Parasphingorhabdus cellanae]QTD55840.1 TonB-dependent siderophore receptor [Parasphingorhabdus cellanae]